MSKVENHFMRSALLIPLLVCFSFSMRADTFQVTNTFDGSAGSFRVALEMANLMSSRPDTIIIDPALTGDTIQTNIRGALNYYYTIRTPLVIEGNGIVFRAIDIGAFFQLVSPNVEIYDVTFQNIRVDQVGLAAIRTNQDDGTFLISGCTFRNNTSTAPNNQGRGVAIWQDGGTGTIEDCHFENNSTTLTVGAAIYATGDLNPGDPNHQLEVSNCTFVNNSGTDPILIGCGVDYILRDPSGEAGLRTGCPSASVSLPPGFIVPSGVGLSIPLITF